jgi:hypothetical protein
MMGVGQLFSFSYFGDVLVDAVNHTADGNTAEPPERAVIQLPQTHYAEVSITFDGVRVFTHIGPTRATFAAVLRALQGVVEQLQSSGQVQKCTQGRKAA